MNTLKILKEQRDEAHRRAGCVGEGWVEIAFALDKAIEALEERDEWRHQLAYYSNEPVEKEPNPTPTGVKKFIDELLEENERLKQTITVKEFPNHSDICLCKLNVVQAKLDSLNEEVCPHKQVSHGINDKGEETEFHISCKVNDNVSIYKLKE